MKENKYGIKYTKPTVILLQDTGIGTSEIAARTCYDSFGNSEHDFVHDFDESHNIQYLDDINSMDHSELLYKLAHVHFHHSILEHANLTFLITGTSRAVLAEYSRHRIQAISVRSTRYTMSSLINAFTASLLLADGFDKHWFIEKVKTMDMFVTSDEDYNAIEIGCMYDKLVYQRNLIGKDEFTKISVAKSSLDFITNCNEAEELFQALENGKDKRNVGDAFKHIITDNVKVDLVSTFNVRSLRNFYTLRDSGAAFFQIKWLAEEMKNATPKKYLDLMFKPKDDNPDLVEKPVEKPVKSKSNLSAVFNWLIS